MTAPDRVIEHVTCLGCGCACDDIGVTVRDGRIVSARMACELGVAWFGDGALPREIRSQGKTAPLDAALRAAAALLTKARRPLVYLAGDLTCEAQRESVALADRLHALLDTTASDTVASSILAAQRRGRATATLGEIRQRADLVVFWAVDPARRYPRYGSRYAVDPVGLQAPAGRKSRTLFAVDVGSALAVEDADARLVLPAEQEIDALAVMRAVVLGRTPSDLGALAGAVDLAKRMTSARYVALVNDAEPSALAPDPARAEGLVALAQALNGPTRCALSTLRAGGNRSGAEAVATWQTGFPFAIDFAGGVPRYRPSDGAAAALARGTVDAALVLGAPSSVPEPVSVGLAQVPCVVIGPRASSAAFRPAVIIDSGLPGVHEGGMAFRMDDVPLPLSAIIPTPSTTVDVVRSIARLVGPA
jgi:formylmethanofuran dehydrogenase subunit B